MANIKYSGPTTIGALVAKVKALVNAVQVSANNANTNAQTASAEAKYYGTCATAATTVAKTITCVSFILNTGAKIAIKFTNNHAAATATFNVNGTGAKPVSWVGSTTAMNDAWSAGEIALFVYDGASYHLIKSAVLEESITPITLGGTGATTAAAALSNLGAAASNHTHTLANLGAAAATHSHTASDVGASPTDHKHSATDITSGTLSIDRGGTGQTTAAGILSAIGAAPAVHSHTAAAIGAAAANHSHTADSIGASPTNHNHSTDNITSGILPVTRGGTGASTTAGILVAIGGAAANHGHTAADVGAAPASHNHSIENITSGTLPIARGGTGGATADAACAALGAAKRILYNSTIDTSWTANGSNGFYKTVSISGILSTDVPIVGVVLSSDVAAAKLQGAAFACVNRIVTNNGSITLYAFNSAPTTTVSIQLLVLR